MAWQKRQRASDILPRAVCVGSVALLVFVKSASAVDGDKTPVPPPTMGPSVPQPSSKQSVLPLLMSGKAAREPLPSVFVKRNDAESSPSLTVSIRPMEKEIVTLKLSAPPPFAANVKIPISSAKSARLKTVSSPFSSAQLFISPPPLAVLQKLGSAEEAKAPQTGLPQKQKLQPIALRDAGTSKQGLAGGTALTFLTSDGEKKRILVDSIWRLRKAAAINEPENAWVVYHAGGKFYAMDESESILDIVKRRVKLDSFTAPNGHPIFIASSKIDHVLEAVRGKHHENAKSLIMTKWGTQQVQEPTYAVNRTRQLAEAER